MNKPPAPNPIDAAITVLVAAGFEEDGHTRSEQVRVGTTKTPILNRGKSGGTIRTFGGRQRFRKGDRRVTIGKRTTCFYRVREHPDWVQRTFDFVNVPTRDLERIREEAGMDPAHVEWCRQRFAMLATVNRWAIPRAGVIFERQGDELVMVERMPHDPAMPISAAELSRQQDEEFEINRRYFAAAGIRARDASKTQGEP